MWLLAPARRVPGTGSADLVAALRLAFTSSARSLEDLGMRRGAAYRRFWEPFCIATLNTPPSDAAASLLGPFLRRVLFGGAGDRDPCVAAGGLREAFVAPALRRLTTLGVEITSGQALRAPEVRSGRVCGLQFAQRRIVMGDGDAVVLAVPARHAARMVPGPPRLPHSAIAVAHFLTEQPWPLQLVMLLADRRCGC